MILLIDAGNTRTKWAWLDALHAVESADNTALWGAALPFAQAVSRATQIWVSNVAGVVWHDCFSNLQTPAQLHWVQAQSQACGLWNQYDAPAQLGSDRWCSLIGAWQQAGRSALVVTAGTAMTLDALIHTAEACLAQDEPRQDVPLGSAKSDEAPLAYFMGGSIQPGLHLMWRSLQLGTAQLDYAWPTPVAFQSWARNTQEAMLQGCVYAMTAAITARYAQLSSKLRRAPALIMSGGDAPLLQTYLPAELSAQAVIVDNLVLSGLAMLAKSSGNI